MKAGNGPEDLPQFEDRFLYHLVDIAGDQSMGHLNGVADRDLAARLADELGVTHEFIWSEAFFTSPAYDAVKGAVEELENEGLLTVPIKETGSWDLRPTRKGRRQVAQWREEWEHQRSKQDREIQRLILQELERQWRSDPEMHQLTGHIEVERFCKNFGIEYDAYLTNAYRLLDQGKIRTMPISEATPASGGIHITETGRRALEVSTTMQRPQRDAQEAWVEVARLKRRLQLIERSLPSLIADNELRQRCEDLLAADAHYDRVVREACVILENRVRKAIGANKSLVGTSLMERAFGSKSGLLRLSEEDQEQLGAMQIYRGVMAFFRNAAGHNLVETYTQEDALRFVVFVDLLVGMVSKASGDQQGDSEAEGL